MIPKTLYEALPGLYLVVAFWGAVAASNLAGYTCAALLTSAALYIIRLRREFRRMLDR